MIPAILALAALSLVAFSAGPLAVDHEPVAKKDCNKKSYG